MTTLIVWVVGTTVVSVASAISSGYSWFKTKHTIKKLDDTITKVKEISEDKIAEALIKKAIEKAADEKVDDYMRDTESDVLKAADRNLEIQARNAVEKCSKQIRDEASKEISRQVANLDVEKLKKRVCDMAEEHVLEKFDDCLDNSVKKFEKQLENTSKMYDGVTKAAVKKELSNDWIYRVWLQE